MTEQTNNIDELLAKGEYNDAKNICMQIINSGSVSIQVLEKLLKCKIKLNEECKDVFTKIINYYLQQNEFKKALKIFKELLILYPNFNKRFYYLGSINFNLGDFKTARKFFNSGIKENDSPSDCYFGLGLIEKKLNNEDEAIKFFSESIKINETVSNLNEIGKIFMESSKNQNYKRAEFFFEKAMNIEPTNVKASINHGVLMQKQFRFHDSFKSFIFPFFKNGEYELDKKNKTFNILSPYIMMSLNNMAFNNVEFTENHIKIFNYVLKFGNFKTESIVNIVNSIVVSKITKLINRGIVNNFIIEEYKIKKYILNLDAVNSMDFYKNEELINFLKSDIVIKHLESIIVTNILVEKFLTSVRKFCLKQINNSLEHFKKESALHEFLGALCNQSFMNEYCWYESDQELIDISNLKKIIISKIKKNIDISDHEIQILGSYSNLNSYDLDFKKIKKVKLSRQTNEIITKQIRNYDQEKLIAKEIPSISKINNNISKKVSKQYENFPYPRWEAGTFDGDDYKYIKYVENAILPNKLPSTFIENNQKINNLLIAGCGTGRHPIHIAKGDKSLKIDAIDLSFSSLSYGKRKAEELGVNSINWMHGDILDLNKIKNNYDAIECCGVLHHMEDPVKGFKILDNKLKPGGIMKIALYSRSFRSLLLPAREILSKLKTKKIPKEIRTARSEIIKDSNKNLRIVKKLPDFYSTSEFIDLLLHEQELDFNIKDLKRLYGDKYEFLGFAHNDKNIYSLQNLYKNKFKDDPQMTNLENWGKLEEYDPNIFSSMYQFFLYKKIYNKPLH